MRRSVGWVLVGASAVVLLLAALPGAISQEKPPPSGGGPMAPGGEMKGPSTQLKYFLHFAGEASAPCEAAKLSLTDKDSADAEKCGEFKPDLGNVCPSACVPAAPEGGLVHPLREKFNYSVSAMFPGKIHFDLWFDYPDRVKVGAAIRVGGDAGLVCAFGQWGAEPTTVMGGEWTTFEEDCTFYGGGGGNGKWLSGAADQEDPSGPGVVRPDQQPKATGSLDVQLSVRSTLGYYVGYESSRAGWITFGADPPETKNTTDNRSRLQTTPAKEAPGPAFGVGLVVALALVEGVRRQRRG